MAVINFSKLYIPTNPAVPVDLDDPTTYKEYNVVDDYARRQINQILEAIKGGIHFLGAAQNNPGSGEVPISEGSNTKPWLLIDKDGQIVRREITPKNGDIVVYGTQEFIFSGDWKQTLAQSGKWVRLGDQTGLCDFAFADKGEGNFTPNGSLQSLDESSQETGTVKVATGGTYSSISLTPTGHAHVRASHTSIAKRTIAVSDTPFMTSPPTIEEDAQHPGCLIFNPGSKTTQKLVYGSNYSDGTTIRVLESTDNNRADGDQGDVIMVSPEAQMNQVCVQAPTGTTDYDKFIPSYNKVKFNGGATTVEVTPKQS